MQLQKPLIVALYSGDTARDANLIGASASHAIVSQVASALLHEEEAKIAHDRLADPLQALIREGRRNALLQIVTEEGQANA